LLAGLPITALLGGVLQKDFPVYEAVRLGSPESMASFVERRISAGIKRFQLKVGNNPRDDAARTIAMAADTFGRIDVLVNNAQATRNARIEDITDDIINLTLGSGLLGTIYHMQAALPWLKKQGGSIVNFGSRQGIYGQPGDGIYGAGKEAIRAMTRTAAREWGQFGIRANVINPAGLSPAAEAFLEADAERAQKYYDEMPLGRFGRLDEDIAPIAVFLACDEGHYVTGQTINADGGQVML